MTLFLTLTCCGLLAGCAAALLRTGSGAVIVPAVYCSMVTLHAPGTVLHRLAMHIAVATSCCVLATTALAQYRATRDQPPLSLSALWPLGVYVMTGALAGALSALSLSPFRLRLLYVLYLSALICICALRHERLAEQTAAHAILPPAMPRRLPALLQACALLASGSMAAGAGVGGSAINVPLVRCLGLDPQRAAALARMLAACSGAAGALVYGLASDRFAPGGVTGYAGCIDLQATLILIPSTLLGLWLAQPHAQRLTERWRTAAYISLLLVALFKMAV